MGEFAKHALAFDDILNATTLDDYQRACIRRALRASGFDVAAAAKIVGASRSTMYRHMKLLGVRVYDVRKQTERGLR